ncbi:MAG: glycosyl hydrolase [Leeuwenhoekiella sp.]
MTNKITYVILALLVCHISLAQDYDGSSLESGFMDPATEYRPRTWMHAMSGNMSKVGMTKDLEAIAAAGQGGILLFNVANGIPYGEVAYNSEEHQDILKHTAQECERLNLSFGVHNCNGWSSSGGPWVKPEQSMKMVVYSDTLISGGKELNVNLPQPTIMEGFYKDIAVVAYPALDSEIIDAHASAKITTSDSTFNVDLATDGKNGLPSRLNMRNQKKPWITFDYGSKHGISSIYVSYAQQNVSAFLEISNDGKEFTQVRDFKKSTHVGKKKAILSEQFEPIEARYFRITFEDAIDIREIDFSAFRPFNKYIDYTGLGKPGNYVNAIRQPSSKNIIRKESILVLTESLDKDGLLSVKLPKGNWTVMRFGYTSTGAFNWPASKWGKGLECDKFSRAAFKTHFDAFAKKVIDNSKDIAPNALQYIEIDSYEMGGQNWTDDFESIFEKEKGYDIIPYLPIYAGRYIENATTVENFSFDINDVYTDLMTNNYFKYFTELCNENGLKSYVEPYGGAGAVSTLDVAGQIDIPMTEFWMNRSLGNLNRTVMGAHIYGKNKISAESFTSRPEINWKMHPANAKVSGDDAWVKGVNEFMFHRFAHQPNTHVEPGMTMGFWGSHIDRTQHWWMNAGKAWFKYIARGSYLLRQGYPVADVLVFMGDGTHIGAVDRNRLIVDLPFGLNYDCTNADVLLNRIKIKDQALVLPEGNAYRYLVLQDTDLTTLKTLERLKTIADAGIPIIGNKPKRLAGLKVSASDTKKFTELIDYIWSKTNCTTSYDFKEVKPDMVFAQHEKEFTHRRTEDADIYFFYNKENEEVNYECTFRVANKIPELWNPESGEITKLAQFVTDENQTRTWIRLKPEESVFVIFRESAEGVNAVIEAKDSNSYYLNSENKIEVVTNTSGDYEVVLSNGNKKEFYVKPRSIKKTLALGAPWQVEFLEKHNYKAKVQFDTLSDWKDSSNENIKYYSGEAIYHKTFEIKKRPSKADMAILDLGSVKISAEVFVNGKNAGVLWIAPYTIDIIDHLVKGENSIKIKVYNQWTNRLIGDERFPKQDGGYQYSSYIPQDDSKMPAWYTNNEPMPEGPRTTFDAGQFYKRSDVLISSGLLGPVKILYLKKKELF